MCGLAAKSAGSRSGQTNLGQAVSGTPFERGGERVCRELGLLRSAARHSERERSVSVPGDGAVATPCVATQAGRAICSPPCSPDRSEAAMCRPMPQDSPPLARALRAWYALKSAPTSSGGGGMGGGGGRERVPTHMRQPPQGTSSSRRGPPDASRAVTSAPSGVREPRRAQCGLRDQGACVLSRSRGEGSPGVSHHSSLNFIYTPL